MANPVDETFSIHPETLTLEPAPPRAPATAPRAEPMVRVERLGKKFRIYPHRWGRVIEWLTLGRVIRHDNFWALRDVGFQVGRGESLGIIGVNGSGKSTLLKILSGALYATEGQFTVGGRVLSLLELGTGLNPELTGRQNVIQSARLLGFPASYPQRRMGQIEAFAELGEFFDRPVRLYSSGMLVRLSFSMFACFDPEVFIVDEALSVGDVFFQQKCVKRIEQMLASGVTMLFVSHDMQLVRRLCDRAVLLARGRVEFEGPPDECVTRYYSQASGAGIGEPASGAISAPASRDDLASLQAHDILRAARSRHGAGALHMLWATIQDESGAHSLSAMQMGTIKIRMMLCATLPIPRPSAGLHLFDRLGNLVFAAGTAQLRAKLPAMQAGEQRMVTFRLTLSLQPGEYTLSLGCADVQNPDSDTGVLSDQCEGLGPIAVHAPQGQMSRFYGIAQLPMEVELS